MTCLGSSIEDLIIFVSLVYQGKQKTKNIGKQIFGSGGSGGGGGSIMNAVTLGAGLLGFVPLIGQYIKNLLPEGVRNFLKGGKNFIGDGLRKTGQFFNNLNPFKSKTSKAVDGLKDAVRGARQGLNVLDSVARGA